MPGPLKGIRREIDPLAVLTEELEILRERVENLERDTTAAIQELQRRVEVLEGKP